MPPTQNPSICVVRHVAPSQNMVPEALQDRLKVVEMPLPTLEQLVAVVGSVCTRMQDMDNAFGGGQLFNDVHLHLAQTSPRTMRPRLHGDSSRAAPEGATFIDACHLPAIQIPQPRRIGFCP